jgi:hypothetical protein
VTGVQTCALPIYAGNILKNPMKKENEQLDALSEEILKIRKNESLPLIKTQPDPDNKEHE